MTDNLKPISLYIHWPFCKSKCPYCDFNSHVRERMNEQAFVDALLAELDYICSLIGQRQLISIFFGGGTPSLMSPDAVSRILEYVAKKFRHPGEGRDPSCHLHQDQPWIPAFAGMTEITLEANPTSVEAEKFKGFRDAGVNRVSLGVQSLKQESLAFLGREHSAAEALKAVELAASIFPRYSFDLIYALPDQTVAAWKKELNEALAYAQDHMSLYQLTIEERTAFYHAYHQQKAFELPVEDLAADLYEATQEVMEGRGLHAYEISNHAKPGYESQHNLSYWLGREYIGIGPGAHGRIHMDGSRYATHTLKSPELWLEAVQTQGHGLEESTPLTQQEHMEETLMMRLRLTGPIPLAELPPIPIDYLKILNAEQLLTLNQDSLALTQKGLLLQQQLVNEWVSRIPSG